MQENDNDCIQFSFINVTQKTSVYMNIVLIMKLQNKGTCMLMYFPDLPGTCLYWKKKQMSGN